MTAFKDELPPAREYCSAKRWKTFGTKGAKAAEAEQREYTADEFYRQFDGLQYDEIVNYTDPTGRTAKVRYGTAIRQNVPEYPATNHVIPAGPLNTTAQYPRPDGPGHRG
jgi:hypothetical protein